MQTIGDSMDAAASARQRKDEHLDIVLRQHSAPHENVFDRLSLEHCALPERDLDTVDLSVRFLGRPLALPFLISAMTGGPTRATAINHHLAEAAQQLGIAFGVGSQRVSLDGHAGAGLDKTLRQIAPDVLLLANFGAAQFADGYGVDEARRAIDMVEADALVIHLNPLQEAVQADGGRRWSGALDAIERLVRDMGRPVIAKEVGYGISAKVARQLAAAGIAAIDVAGSGGTAWAAVEGERATSDTGRRIASAFDGWGIPTPTTILAVRRACPSLPIIGSGGIRHGVDAAKAIRLGADLVGQAAPVLQAAMTSTDAVMAHFALMAEQLRIACFCTGSADLAALRTVPVFDRHALPLHDV